MVAIERHWRATVERGAHDAAVGIEPRANVDIVRRLAMRLDRDASAGGGRADGAPMAPEGECAVHGIVAGSLFPKSRGLHPRAVFFDPHRSGPSHLQRALARGIGD